MAKDIDFDNLDFEDDDFEEVPEIKKDTEDDFEGDEGDNEGGDDDDFDSDDVPGAADIIKKAQKSSKSNKNYTPPPPPPPPKKYEGVRHVIVYGDELFEVADPNVTNEEIRQRIVNEFKYPEYAKDRTIFNLNEETGILTVGIKFEKKG